MGRPFSSPFHVPKIGEASAATETVTMIARKKRNRVFFMSSPQRTRRSPLESVNPSLRRRKPSAYLFAYLSSHPSYKVMQRRVDVWVGSVPNGGTRKTIARDRLEPPGRGVGVGAAARTPVPFAVDSRHRFLYGNVDPDRRQRLADGVADSVAANGLIGASGGRIAGVL